MNIINPTKKKKIIDGLMIIKPIKIDNKLLI